MAENHSYDIFVLGLKDPSAEGRHRFAATIEKLTDRSAGDFDDHFPSSVLPMFEALDGERARKTADTLSEAGIIIEVRPVDAPPSEERPVDAPQSEELFEADPHTRSCPACNQRQPAVAEECAKCGVVFAKYEREQLLKMQQDHNLEQAMINATQVRQEWVQRAQTYLETHKLEKDATAEFSTILMKDEVPFLRLDSDEGPLLLTSRRFISENDGKFQSIPYEMIDEVEYGGGRLATSKKAKQRLQINFHSPFPIGEGQAIKNIAWHLDKESSFSKEVVFEWGYARNFICGSCGVRELDYRTDNNRVHMRCMHCATDHEINLVECVAVPALAE